MENSLLEIANFAKSNSGYYAQKYLNYEINTMEDFYKLPLSDSKMFLERQEDLLTTVPNPKSSYVFSTGGSLSKPKNVHLSYDEFHRNVHFHGLSYKKAGLNSEDRVATFGIPGTKTSEFSVYLGLEETGCFILPIGIYDDFEYIYSVLKEHNINSLLVMPTDLISLINYLNSNNLSLNIEKIITGGESLPKNSKEFISNSIGTKHFGSTFQGMDFGTVGYNDGKIDLKFAGSRPVYCINNDDLYVEVLNSNNDSVTDQIGEIVVTNTFRKLSPIVRYKTGDYGIKFFDPKNNKAYIRLMGRVGSKPKVGGEVLDLDVLNDFISDKSFFTGRFQTVITKQNNLDKVLIKVEVVPNVDFSYEKEFEDLIEFLKNNHTKLDNQLKYKYIQPIDVLFDTEENINFYKSGNTKKIVKVVDER